MDVPPTEEGPRFGDGEGHREAQKRDLAQGHVESLHRERSFPDEDCPIRLSALTKGL